MSNIYTTTQINSVINDVVKSVNLNNQELQKICFSIVTILDKNQKKIHLLNSFVKKMKDLKSVNAQLLIIYFQKFSNADFTKGKFAINDEKQANLPLAEKTLWFLMKKPEKPQEAYILAEKLEVLINSAEKRQGKPQAGDDISAVNLDCLRRAYATILANSGDNLQAALDELPAPTTKVTKKKVA